MHVKTWIKRYSCVDHRTVHKSNYYCSCNIVFCCRSVPFVFTCIIQKKFTGIRIFVRMSQSYRNREDMGKTSGESCESSYIAATKSLHGKAIPMFIAYAMCHLHSCQRMRNSALATLKQAISLCASRFAVLVLPLRSHRRVVTPRTVFLLLTWFNWN